MRMIAILGMLIPGARPGSTLAYQSGGGEAQPGMMRSNMAVGAAAAGQKPVSVAAQGGQPRQLGEAIVPAPAVFTPSPVVSVEAIEQAQREAHRLRAEVIHEMLGTAGAWLWRLGRRTIPARRAV